MQTDRAVTRAAAATLAALAGFAACAQEPTLVLNEDFSGDALNTDLWEYMTGTGAQFGLVGWGNNELQYYRSGTANATVGDGVLTITAKRENFGGRAFTSARLRTQNKFDFLYGRVEARMKLPSGAGLWPALWMLPTDSPYGGWAAGGEIDIMESVNIADEIFGTIHFGGAWPRNTFRGRDIITGIDYSEDFHVYALEWEPGLLRWSLDGEVFLTLTAAQWFSENATPGYTRPPFDHPFHFIVNVAVGGNFPGPPNDATPFPQSLVVDYLRVWRVEQAPFHGEPFALPTRIEAEDFDTGYADDAYRDIDATNNGAAYRQEEVDIEANDTGFNVGWIREHEWLEYTVDVPEAGEMPFRARVASEATGGSFRLEADGEPVTGVIEVPSTGGWQDWVEIEGVAAFGRAGEQVLRLQNLSDEGQGWNFDWLQFEGVPCSAADIVEPYGEIDVFDMLAFLAAFDAGDETADIQFDRTLNLIDVFAYVSAADIGCG